MNGARDCDNTLVQTRAFFGVGAEGGGGGTSRFYIFALGIDGVPKGSTIFRKFRDGGGGGGAILWGPQFYVIPAIMISWQACG